MIILAENNPISVIGVGKLGICFALNLEKAGYNVIGVDKNQKYVELINNKQLTSYEPFVEEYLQSSQHFHATTDIKEILKSNMIFILVPTPSLETGRYDHSFVNEVIDEIEKFGQQDVIKHIIISSTVNPEFCDKIQQRLENLNYTLTYNPEFIAQGSVINDQQNPDMILIGGKSQTAGDILEEIYTKMCKNKPIFKRMNLISAEITKIALNCFVTTKISFANSIGDLCETVGAETDKVLSAIGSDSKIGNKCLKYGYGYGGPCLPRDNKALSVFGEDHGIDLLISKATDEINKNHLEFQLKQYKKNSKTNEQIVFDGVTYKKGTVILEESQPFELAIKLAKSGCKIRIIDKPAVIDEIKKIYGSLFEYETK